MEQLQEHRAFLKWYRREIVMNLKDVIETKRVRKRAIWVCDICESHWEDKSNADEICPTCGVMGSWVGDFYPHDRAKIYKRESLEIPNEISR